VIACSAYCLAHVPDLVAQGSKPRREIARDPAFGARLHAARRSFAEALAYPPNQTFIGNLRPEALSDLARPWYSGGVDDPVAEGPFGEIVSQDLLYAALMRADVLEPNLVTISADADQALRELLDRHPAFAGIGGGWDIATTAHLQAELSDNDAIALTTDGRLMGVVRRDLRAEGRDDANLDAHTLLEGLCAKASSALAVARLLHQAELSPDKVDYLISCGEEALGDRYQRGGGGMAKAVGELAGCVNASGMDIKNFCAAPASALVTAGALVKAGLHERVVVVGGGSLAKLGMKSPAFLAGDIPVLDDCLGSMAFLVTADDGSSPVLRLDRGAVGHATVGSSSSDEAIYRDLIQVPLASLGLTMGDVDRYAPELHNPEIMEHSGSGDVVHKNYRMIAAMAVRAGEIDKQQMGSFIERVGMCGFAPTQGHVPSGVPYIGHAAVAMQRGELNRVMFLCKASLFLNRLTELYDGVSFVLESQRLAIRSAPAAGQQNNSLQ
jgi:betaine reductase